ncbi:TetR family transcriptional regulator [Streptomyces eurocidicus]|nr:TetR family transcriptional regulator [Streptomyces eurocidicus]
MHHPPVKGGAQCLRDMGIPGGVDGAERSRDSPHPGAEMIETKPVAGRRERNKQRVRQRLYTAAVTLFAKQGYDQTSIDEITEEADVARATFFNYFQRKEDIIIAWGDLRREKLQAGLGFLAAPRGDVVARLDQCVSALVDINEEERDITRAMLLAWVKAGRPMLEDPYSSGIFAEIVEEGLRQGQISPGVDATRVGQLLRDAYLGALYRWTQGKSAEADLHVELRELFHIVLRGIMPGYALGVERPLAAAPGPSGVTGTA